MRTAQQIVETEVRYCVSTLVSTLAGGVTTTENFSAEGTALADIAWQAFQLASPIDDWEEAAIQAGWTHAGVWFHPDFESAETSPENACYASEGDDAAPYQHEVFEHYAVSDWLADQLEAHGEKVDRDFTGLTVWARTTTGQAIYADPVFATIAANLAR